MSAATHVFDVEVDAPDGATAIDLELRLSRLNATTIGCRDDWIVEIPGPVNLEEIEAIVREWLDDHGRAATTLRAGGQILRIERPRARKRHRALNYDFVG